jgi:hypothetical protein
MASAGFEPTIPAMKLLQTYAIGRGCPTFFLWQSTTPVIVGWFDGRTWKNNNKWYF